VPGFDAKEPSLQTLCKMLQNSTNRGTDAVLFVFPENKKAPKDFYDPLELT